MPTKRTTPAKTTPAAPKAAAPKASGLDQNTILLAALAIHNDGELVVPFAAYGEILARQGDVKGITVRTGATGLEVDVEWNFPEPEDDTKDVVTPVVKSAFSAGPSWTQKDDLKAGENLPASSFA